MEAPMGTDAGREVIDRFLAATESKDLAAMTALVHDDFVMEWPQSGERFSGRDRALRAFLATEEKPEIAGEPSIAGARDLWVIRMPIRYGDETRHYVGIFELHGDLLRRATEYFAEPFPADSARAAYADAAAG